MKKAFWSRMTALVLALCCLTLTPALALTGSFAEVKGEPCSLTVTYDPGGVPAQGVRFRLWKVADISASGYTPLPFVWQYHVLEGVEGWPAKANTLYGYLLREKVDPTVQAETDDAGQVRFADLEQGLYLLAGDELTRGGRVYTPTPNLVCLPNSADFTTWESQVEMVCKSTSRSTGGGGGDDPATVSRHVLKSWEDDGHEEERPQEVVVDLLRDGEVYSTASLTADNNWRWDWDELDARSAWQVVERESDQYAVRVEQQGITFQITNTWRDRPEEDLPEIDTPRSDLSTDPDASGTDLPEEQLWDPDIPLVDPNVPAPDPETPAGGDKLPQTGQLWWPVAPMALCGLACLAVGLVRRRRWSARNE